jgi:hypothetical protein
MTLATCGELSAPRMCSQVPTWSVLLSGVQMPCKTPLIFDAKRRQGSVLLSHDAVKASVRNAIEEACGCAVSPNTVKERVRHEELVGCRTRAGRRRRVGCRTRAGHRRRRCVAGHTPHLRNVGEVFLDRRARVRVEA